MVLLGRRAQRVIVAINATAAKLRHELLADIPDGELEACMRVLGRIRERAEKGERRQAASRKRASRVLIDRNGQAKQRHSILRKSAISRRDRDFK